MPVSLSAEGISCYFIVAFPTAPPVASLPPLAYPRLSPPPFSSPPPSSLLPPPSLSSGLRTCLASTLIDPPPSELGETVCVTVLSASIKTPGGSGSAAVHPADAFRVAAAIRTSHGFNQLRCLRPLLPQEEDGGAKCRLREQGRTQVCLLQSLFPPLIAQRGPSPVPGVQPGRLRLQASVLSDGGA